MVVQCVHCKNLMAKAPFCSWNPAHVPLLKTWLWHRAVPEERDAFSLHKVQSAYKPCVHRAVCTHRRFLFKFIHPNGALFVHRPHKGTQWSCMSLLENHNVYWYTGFDFIILSLQFAGKFYNKFDTFPCHRLRTSLLTCGWRDHSLLEEQWFTLSLHCGEMCQARFPLGRIPCCNF